MAKRKTKKVQLSRAQLMQKRRGKLDKEFLCYYCQHEKSVAIKIDNQSGVGFLSCRICGVKFSTRVTVLDEAVDVYALWMDSCREGQRGDTAPQKKGTADTVSTQAPLQSKSIAKKTQSEHDTPRADKNTPAADAATPEDALLDSKEEANTAKPSSIDPELASAAFSAIGGGKRSKRIIDAVEETHDETEYAVGTLTGENLFEDD
ncbi:transcription elongation factor 1 [Babesia ovata]|uniref:Transcription elongation factor 1 homolog n=1 Tax=Babesia ovata TaxID=189622 RepID=A0A2H6KHK4_9APIC|nr:transcription elongation factor 1 [Babesia ovata]GBE62476.1 transcription elongation factor 1 [Babesia ovata]